MLNFQTLNWVVRNSCDLETQFVSVERIRDICANEKEADWEIGDINPGKDWPKTGAIEFTNFTSRYR